MQVSGRRSGHFLRTSFQISGIFSQTLASSPVQLKEDAAERSSRQRTAERGRGAEWEVGRWDMENGRFPLKGQFEFE